MGLLIPVYINERTGAIYNNVYATVMADMQNCGRLTVTKYTGKTTIYPPNQDPDLNVPAYIARNNPQMNHNLSTAPVIPNADVPYSLMVNVYIFSSMEVRFVKQPINILYLNIPLQTADLDTNMMSIVYKYLQNKYAGATEA